MTKRHRTVFPNTVNFDGWFFVSPKRSKGQLVSLKRRDEHDRVLYRMCFDRGKGRCILGHAVWTMDGILSGGIKISRE
jgi:hypothetical protein